MKDKDLREEKRKADQEKLLRILRRHNSKIDRLAKDCRKERGVKMKRFIVLTVICIVFVLAQLGTVSIGRVLGNGLPPGDIIEVVKSEPIDVFLEITTDYIDHLKDDKEELKDSVKGLESVIGVLENDIVGLEEERTVIKLAGFIFWLCFVLSMTG